MWGLIYNPFERKITYDINDLKQLPFIPLKCHRILYEKIKFNVNSPYPIYQLLLGERGIGKTTSLLSFYDYVLKLGAKACYSNKLGDPVLQLFGLLGGDINDFSMMKFEELAEGKTYFFIDFPDKFKTKKLEFFLEELEKFFNFKNVSIIIALNKSHYNTSFKYSEIFGKFSSLTIDRFSDSMAIELVKARLEKSRDKNYGGDSLHPFSKDIIRLANRVSAGIPRNLLSACEYLLMEAEFLEKKKIDAEFAKKVLSSEEFARKIVEERVEDETYRRMLTDLYRIVRERFSGYVKTEETLINEVKKELGWSRMTVKKRIRDLAKLGLIRIRKSPVDLWRNEIVLTTQFNKDDVPL